jgi:hypothetical protein
MECFERFASPVENGFASGEAKIVRLSSNWINLMISKIFWPYNFLSEKDPEPWQSHFSKVWLHV